MENKPLNIMTLESGLNAYRLIGEIRRTKESPYLHNKIFKHLNGDAKAAEKVREVLLDKRIVQILVKANTEFKHEDIVSMMSLAEALEDLYNAIQNLGYVSNNKIESEIHETIKKYEKDSGFGTFYDAERCLIHQEQTSIYPEHYVTLQKYCSDSEEAMEIINMMYAGEMELLNIHKMREWIRDYPEKIKKIEKKIQNKYTDKERHKDIDRAIEALNNTIKRLHNEKI